MSAEYDRAAFTARFDDLKEIICLLRGKSPDQPFIENEKIDSFVGPDGLLECSEFSRHIQLIQKFRHAYVAHSPELSAGSVAQSTGNIRFAASGRTFQYDVVMIINVLTGGEPVQFSFIQFSVLVVLDLFDRSARSRELSGFYEPAELVVPSAVPFGIDQKENLSSKSRSL